MISIKKIGISGQIGKKTEVAWGLLGRVSFTLEKRVHSGISLAREWLFAKTPDTSGQGSEYPNRFRMARAFSEYKYS